MSCSFFISTLDILGEKHVLITNVDLKELSGEI
jgi:hypothetical protein